MTNYTRITDFTSKDALATGNPSKVILGSEHQAEFDSIATHIATKQDGINTLSAETAIVAADALSFYDDSAGSHKKITYTNLKNTLYTFASDTFFIVVSNALPVVTGFGAGSYNSMAGYANATESADLGGVVTNWKVTPGTAGTWLLGFNIIFSHDTTFGASTYLLAGITRYNSSNVAQARYLLTSDNDPEGLTYSYQSGSTVHNISSATDYFTIDTFCNSGNYNVYNLYFWGWRVK